MEPPKESTSAATAEEAPQVFTGAVPSADVEKVIRLLINDVKKMNSRDLEQKMLESDRVSFSFLDPDDEFHDFYLYLLRQTAPNCTSWGTMKKS
ncbi:hypothetical protein AGDE_15136 [Angomonas deanei]|uniref:SURP motif domain-containing protein n=1 Tax=Angomonas deanei TaxID=59799 RepID=A0A7G2CCJ6_9TRYP|nr:hypothetical protein AGDE_15136 [Angomonas deanei]CAD2217536.1 hypothetical protein, conserved [Angomonas deanei]|eukprot:EPY19639.1 hypothetical protein AGDE_15136 [Angomonas deanei]